MKKLASFIIVTGILMSLTGCGKGKADAVSAQSVRVEDIKNNVSGIEDIEFTGNIEDSQPYWNSSAVHSVAREGTWVCRCTENCVVYSVSF